MYCKSISFEGIDYTIIFVHIYVFNSSLDCLILSGSFFYVIIFNHNSKTKRGV